MISELDPVIRQSLKSLVEEVFDGAWFGREREVVSLYAFGHLQQHFREGHVLNDPTQIVLEAAVPQVAAPGRKRLVCKDLVIWPRALMTCWNEEQEPVQRPLAIVEWKVNATSVSRTDVNWLCAFSRWQEDFVGYAVCLDLEQRRFKLSSTRVYRGEAQAEWLVVW
jgi:hypothetical protein